MFIERSDSRLVATQDHQSRWFIYLFGPTRLQPPSAQLSPGRGADVDPLLYFISRMRPAVSENWPFTFNYYLQFGWHFIQILVLLTVCCVLRLVEALRLICRVHCTCRSYSLPFPQRY